MNAQGPHHQPVHRIRLSLCSHGNPDERPDPDVTTRLVHGDPRMRYYLDYLSNEFSKSIPIIPGLSLPITLTINLTQLTARHYGQHFGHPQFIFLDLPAGYSLWWRPRGNSINNRSGVRNGDFFL